MLNLQAPAPQHRQEGLAPLNRQDLLRALLLDRGRVVHEDHAATLREDSAALERHIGLAVQ
ncbi:hypothetical protein [Ideonella livida]|uniref:Uncharacterized protein n=1 Tax=Ideonella livida TaxID=2707176 RepID=A0A7C9TLI1_9BURK|nr:hypothetical protein [Ideonella livida]NDY93539.1 hypothetical protein [Ideonella livida]